MKRSFLRLAVACISVLAAPAHAAEISAVKLEHGIALFIIGDIKPGDGAQFRSEASKYQEATVFLESDGGSVTAAIDIGETIRLKGYATAVINDSRCNSACDLIWLAGSPRALSRSGKVGFHAAYSEAAGSPRESGVANAMVGRYLTLLNLPEKAIIFATSSPPSSLQWLTSSNYLQTGIDVKVINDIHVADGSAKAKAVDPPPLIRIGPAQPKAKKADTDVWRKLDPWTVMVDHTLNEGCFILASFERDTVFRVGVNRASGAGYYVLFGNPAWESLKDGQEYDVHFQFDGNTPWDMPTTGVDAGGIVLLKVLFNDATFWKEFVSSKALAITRNGKSVTTLTLSGVQPAFDELVNCQKYEDAQKRGQDPFAQ